ncbi:MAG: ParM/StbA family protein [Selenomonadales bacterium]|nr:ParM/StbA family protein [Selenomonadales bacterium]
MFKIGLDLGYGYVKGVNETGKAVSFPSLVGEAYDRPLSGLFGAGMGEETELHLVISDSEGRREFFAGDLARREGKNVSFAFDEDKIAHPNTKALLAAAALLLFPQTPAPVHLVTGLPLEQYIHKREEFREMLSRMVFSVHRKDGVTRKQISFAKTTVFPQAAGAVYYAIWDDRQRYLNKGSYLGLVDVGFKTTDFVVFLVEDRLVLREDLSGTIPVGVSYLQTATEKLFADRTGTKLDVAESMRLVQSGKLIYKGREMDFSRELEDVKQELGRGIKDRLKTVWGNKINFFHTVFLAGGGAVALERALGGLHPTTTLVKDPRFANARGFLKVAEELQRTGLAV